MKEKILTVVKYFKWVYSIYYHVGSFALNVLKIFVKTDDDLILFVSYGGKSYNDSPAVLYEKMCMDGRFKNKKLVWAFRNPDEFDVSNKIKIDTVKYYLTAIKARCWITNSGIERGLNFKGKKTFYLNTWHGTPMKKMGVDINDNNESFKSNAKFQADVILAQGDYEVEKYSRAFEVEKERFAKLGYPRNDDLSTISQNEILSIKSVLGIPKDKRVVLLAPTFREYERNSAKECICNIPIDFSRWEKELVDNYVIITRLHYEIAKKMDLERYKGFVFDCTEYPKLNDLMKISDLLISDYSSLMFDYSILEKPIICFAYDLETYREKRGLYIEIDTYLDGGKITEDELLQLITSLDLEAARKKSREFRETFVNYYGSSTEKVLDLIEQGMR